MTKAIICLSKIGVYIWYTPTKDKFINIQWFLHKTLKKVMDGVSGYTLYMTQQCQ